jgi:GLPGLI family protein
MKTFIKSIILFLVASVNFCYAQNARFTTSGTVEYDKSSNVYAIMPRLITKENEYYMKPAYDQVKKMPQFRVLKSTLKFGDNKTLFTPIPPETNTQGVNLLITEQMNTVYSDLDKSVAVSEKEVYGDKMLVTDSTRKIDWKITGETRDIAGYTCRRANALILDSIYVVAFYAEKIPVSGGPELFSGLPGMILMVALPHENIIWTATKVTDAAIPANQITAPKKGKPVNAKAFREALEGFMKQVSLGYRPLYYKAFLL